MINLLSNFWYLKYSFSLSLRSIQPSLFSLFFLSFFNIAIYFFGENKVKTQITFNELHSEVAKVAYCFRNLGIRRGDRIAVTIATKTTRKTRNEEARRNSQKIKKSAKRKGKNQKREIPLLITVRFSLKAVKRCCRKILA